MSAATDAIERDDDWYRVCARDDQGRRHTTFVRADSIEEAATKAEAQVSLRPIEIEHIPEERIRLWKSLAP